MLNNPLNSFVVVGTAMCAIFASEKALADGGCCWPDGSCSVVVLPDDCWGQGGEYLGDGTDCTGQVCTGACCQPDGTCVEDSSPQGCWDQAGFYFGRGTDCLGVDCIGACCLPDATCVDDLTADACGGIGGWWTDPTLDCGTVPCTGACCCVGPGNTCTDSVSIDACDSLGGIWPGPPGSNCVSNCLPPEECPPSGACCLPDGSCVDDFHDFNCFNLGGSYQGDGSDCASSVCTGACCMTDASCINDVAPSQCSGMGGEYRGDGSECTTSVCTGACCMPDASCVDDVAPDVCWGMGGWWPDEGYGSTCATVTCTGACCCGGPSGECADSLSLDDCIAAGGYWPGPPGSTCEFNCPLFGCPGACCLENGTCEVRLPWDCTADNGIFLGDGAECLPDACTGLGCSTGVIGRLDDPENPANDDFMDVLAARVLQSGTTLTFVIETRGTIPTTLPLPDDGLTFLWYVDADLDWETGQPHGGVGSDFNVRAVIHETLGGGFVDVTGTLPGGGNGTVAVQGNEVRITVDSSQINSPPTFNWRCYAFGEVNGAFTDSGGDTIVVSAATCGSAIPTVSAWGMVAMTLLLLAAATVIMGRRLARPRTN